MRWGYLAEPQLLKGLKFASARSLLPRSFLLADEAPVRVAELLDSNREHLAVGLLQAHLAVLDSSKLGLNVVAAGDIGPVA